MMALAKRVFPLQKGLARWNLTISHAKRKIINKMCFDAQVSRDTLNVQLGDELVNKVFVGCPLIGNTTGKKIVNGCLYVVQSFTPTMVTIRNLENDEIIDVSVDHMKNLRLSFAICYFSVQGRTLREHTRLWDTDHKCFSTRHLAMAIGRVTKPEDLSFAYRFPLEPLDPECFLIQNVS